MSDEERKLRGASQKDCTGYELQRAHSPHVEDEGAVRCFFHAHFWKAACPLSNCQTYGLRSAHTMEYSQRGGLMMPTAKQAPDPAITVIRHFVGQQTAETLPLELIRAHMQTA